MIRVGIPSSYFFLRSVPMSLESDATSLGIKNTAQASTNSCLRTTHFSTSTTMAGHQCTFTIYPLSFSDSSLAPGFHPHLPGRRYTLLAKGVGATMWFFIFYRLRSVYSSPLLLGTYILPQTRRRETFGIPFHTLYSRLFIAYRATILSWTTVMTTRRMPDITENLARSLDEPHI